MAFVTSTPLKPAISWSEYKAWLEGFLHTTIGDPSAYQLGIIKDKLDQVRVMDGQVGRAYSGPSAGQAMKQAYYSDSEVR